MTHRILLTLETFDDDRVEREVLSGPDVDLQTVRPDSVDELVEMGEDADVILSQGVELDADVIERLSHLDVIGVYGTGTDSVDMNATNEHGITVLNVPEYGVDEVSTHALSLILGSIRKLRTYDEHVRDGGWDWKRGAPLHGPGTMTVGLVAYGKIAQALGRKCDPVFGDVIAFDPYVPDEEMDVPSVGLDKLLERSDIVSVHSPLTAETRGLLGQREFERMKETAVLVNTSRGAVVDTDALAAALSAGEIAYAGLDVHPSEPPAGDHPLFELENAILTPHIGWYSEEAADRLRQTLAKDVKRFLEGEEPKNVVDAST